MNESQQRDVIDGIFSALKGIDLVHENEKYDGSNDEWIRVSCQVGKGKRINLGDNPIYRYYGVCFVQIFVKPDTGSGRATEIADMITPLIRDKYIDGLQFFVPEVVKVGEVNGWYQVNVLTEFYRED